VDLATWQWRAVLLRRDDDGMVRSCVFGPGPRPEGEEPDDPARWYRRPDDKERAKNPSLPARADHRLRPDREVWRDADALVAALASRDTPGVLAWDVDHRDAPVFEVLVGGALAELKGSWVVTGTRSAHLPVPRAVLLDGKLIQRVSLATAHAVARAKDLRSAAFTMARELVRQAPDAEPSRRRAEDLVPTIDPTPRYWASLPAAFDVFMREIADPSSMDRWTLAVDDEARRALGEATAVLVGTPRGLRAAAAATRRLHSSMARDAAGGIADTSMAETRFPAHVPGPSATHGATA
jgi:hypothetical protein